MCRNLTASDFGAERSETQLEWEERERKETESERARSGGEWGRWEERQKSEGIREKSDFDQSRKESAVVRDRILPCHTL